MTMTTMVMTMVINDYSTVQYSGPNYAAFDIGNLFNEYDDDYEYQDYSDHDDNGNCNQGDND